MTSLHGTASTYDDDSSHLFVPDLIVPEDISPEDGAPEDITHGEISTGNRMETQPTTTKRKKPRAQNNKRHATNPRATKKSRVHQAAHTCESASDLDATSTCAAKHKARNHKGLEQAGSVTAIHKQAAGSAHTSPQAILRYMSMYPPFLFDVGRTGYVTVSHSEVVAQARRVEQRILTGQQPYGFPLVIPSFQSPAPIQDFCMPALIQGLFIMHTLYSHHVMDTKRGVVCLWPVMVYPSQQDQDTQTNGYPVVAVPRGLLKVVIKCCYSSVREVVTQKNFDEPFRDVMCQWNPVKDSEPLLSLSGLDPYQIQKLQATHGFILLPWIWFRVMCHAFTDEQGRLYSLSTLFQQTYQHIPECWFSNNQHKFSPMYQDAWLGSERPIYVDGILHEPHIHHAESMCRNRAYNGMIRRGPYGPIWLLPPTLKHTCRTPYHDLSFGIGVTCFDRQLGPLNTLYASLTDQHVPHLSHLLSPLMLDGITPVGTREDSIRQGMIHDAAQNQTPSNSFRRRKYALCKRLGETFTVNFWGVVKPLYRATSGDNVSSSTSTVRAPTENATAHLATDNSTQKP